MITLVKVQHKMAKVLNIADVNTLSEEDFIHAFGNVVEGFPRAAYESIKFRPFNSTQQIVDSIATFLETLSSKDKEEVLRLHPDLAGSLTDEGKLTADSAKEQQAAGLYNLSTSNKQEITQLNKRYQLKFGFPFVICARDNKVAAILAGLKKRLNNSREVELENGISEVKKISTFRIRELVKNT